MMAHSRSIAAALLVLGLAAASGVRAQTGAGELKPVASVEGITEYDLANGMRVLLFPDPSKETMTVNVTYLVGSRNESYGETGMAHLLEHMMFKGTPNHTDIYGSLTAHGARTNASTWYDRTNYFEIFPASDDNLVWALGLEADRMVNSFIAKKDLDSEMTVVRNEFEVDENDPERVLSDRVTSTAYLWHNYGKSTIGARSDIEDVPIERLQAFYHKFYQPDNAVLVVGGKIDPAKTLALVQKTFGAIPRPDRVLENLYTREPAQDGERSTILRRVGDKQVVMAAYHIPSGSHPDFPAVEVLSFILGDTPSGRLHKALVETNMAASVSASPFQFKDPGLLVLQADLPPDHSIEAVRDTLLHVAESVGTASLSDEEVARAREHLLKDWQLSMQDSQRAAIGLSEWSAMGDWRLMFLQRDRLAAVKPDDVRRVAAAYLRRVNRTVGLYIPTQTAERVEIPASPDIAALVGSYHGGAGMASGEEFDASPENIEAHVVRVTLPSGMKIAMLPKKTRGGSVQVALTLHMGDEKSLKGLAAVGDLTGSMLMRGTTRHTRQQIQDAIDRMQARLSVEGSASDVSAGITVSGDSLQAALRLVAEILRSPAFPASELDQLKQEQITQLDEAKTDPRAMAQRTLRRYLNPWPAEDVRYIATPDEQISAVKAVTLDQIRDFHRKFYGASAAEIGVVGDFDPKAVTAALTQLFGDWKSATPFTRLAASYQDRPAIHQSLEAPDKESAVYAGGLRVPVRDDDPDYPALSLGNFMTGGGFLSSRLATRIRQKEGLSYGVGSMFFANPWDKDGYFGFFAIYAPQNDEKLVNAFQEEIAKIVDKGFTADEVKAAQSGWLQARMTQRSQDRELARGLASHEYQGRTYAWEASLEKSVAGLTADAVNAAMRRDLDPAKISVVRAGDFAKVAKTGQNLPH